MADLSNQINMNMMQVNSQIVNGLSQISAFKSSSSSKTANGVFVPEINTKNTKAYAVKGDYKYKDEMDTDSNGTVTFNEYVKYISEQKFDQNSSLKSLYNLTKYTKTTDAESGLQLLTMFNYGKALRTYINSSAKLPTAKISAEG